MKPLLALFAAALVTSGCYTDVVNYKNHWRHESVGTSLSRHFLNAYDPHEDGLYRAYQWDLKEDINLTLMRHLGNVNPENPESYEVSWYPRTRPPHSLVPYLWDYMQMESIVWGAIMLGATGYFVPIPVGSVLGSLEPGGGQEFADGFRMAFGGKGAVTASFHLDGNGQEVMRATWVPLPQ